MGPSKFDYLFLITAHITPNTSYCHALIFTNLLMNASYSPCFGTCKSGLAKKWQPICIKILISNQAAMPAITAIIFAACLNRYSRVNYPMAVVFSQTTMSVCEYYSINRLNYQRFLYMYHCMTLVKYGSYMCGCHKIVLS